MNSVQMVKNLKKKLVKIAKTGNDTSDILLLIAFVDLCERAIREKKIDACAMGAYGMSVFFDTAPEDCGRLGAKLVDTEDGGVKVEIFPVDDPDFGKEKVELN